MRLVAITFSVLLLFSCNGNETDKKILNKTIQTESVQKSVKKMAADIAHDLSVAGPIAWLNYFEQSPNFFMANDGQRVFANNDSATHFVKEILAKNIMKINLVWNNLMVDSLSPSLAVFSANYHENMIDKDNNNITADGYFTGTVEMTAEGWKLRNLHWSSLKK